MTEARKFEELVRGEIEVLNNRIKMINEEKMEAVEIGDWDSVIVHDAEIFMCGDAKDGLYRILDKILN